MVEIQANSSKKRLLRPSVALFGLLFLALLLPMLVPQSPFFASRLFLSSPLHHGRSFAAWIKLLNTESPSTRFEAILGVASSPASEEEKVLAASRLGQILASDPNAALRGQAALGLSKLAPESEVALLQLVESLGEEDLLVRLNSAKALIPLGPKCGGHLASLRQAIQDPRNRTNGGVFPQTIQQTLTMAASRTGDSSLLELLVGMLGEAENDLARITLANAVCQLRITPGSAEDKKRHEFLATLFGEQSEEVSSAAKQALAQCGYPEPAKAKETKPQLVLPQGDREYLWEIEQHGNLLTKFGFSRISDFIKTGNWKELDGLLATDFSTNDPNPGPGQSQSWADQVAQVNRTVRQERPAGDPKSQWTREHLFRNLEGLLAPHSYPGAKTRVKLSLMNLGPSERKNLSGKWEGTGQLRIWSTNETGRLAETVCLARYAISQPTEGSLSGGGWIHSLTIEQALTGESERAFFAENSKARGIDGSWLEDNWRDKGGHITTGGVFLCDLNHDGHMDILITDIRGNALYLGSPKGIFENATIQLGLPSTPTLVRAAAWIDIDNDGWEDLVLGQKIYRNHGGQKFEDQGKQAFLPIPDDAGNLVVGDYDRDGRLDIYIARSALPGSNSWLDDHSNDRKGNILLRNTGDWKFEDVTARTGTRGGARSTFTAAWLDANNDGWPDLHVPNEFGDGVLLVNTRDGKFREEKLSDSPSDFGTMGLATGDLDNDGNIDIYCANMYSKAGTRVIGNMEDGAFPIGVMGKLRRFVAGSQLHFNRGNQRFESAGSEARLAAVGWAYGPAIADFNNDGHLDIYGTAGYMSVNPDEPDG